MRDLASHVSGALIGALTVVTAVGVVAAPVLIAVFAPGFLSDPAKYALAVEMVRITFPYVLFISLVAFAGGILNTYGRFAVPALTPVLLNACLIGAALWLAPVLDVPVVALAWGVLAAGIGPACVSSFLSLPRSGCSSGRACAAPTRASPACSR